MRQVGSFLRKGAVADPFDGLGLPSVNKRD